MKYLILILFGFTFSLTNAQRPTQQGGQRGTAPKIGSVTGSIIDTETEAPVSYATITVIHPESKKTVAGALSDEKGKFLVEEIPLGTYNVEISFIGYASKTLGPLTFSPKEKVKHNIGIVKIGADNELEAVVVEAEGNPVRYEVDKKVYDVSKIRSAEGGTARDVLEQIPSITVTSDQNLQLRGSENVRVLVNGRPSTYDLNTILEQIPQKQIKDIEIITNPSAKYDAEGEVGIINIVLKDNNLEGITGSVNANYGTWGKYSGGGNIGFKTKKWNLSTSANHRHFEDDFTRIYNRTLLEFPAQNQYSNTDRDFTRRNTSFRLGADYYIDKNNTIFLSGGMRFSDDDDVNTGINKNSYTNLFNGVENIPSNFYTYDRNGTSSEKGEGKNFSASFQHLFGGNMNHNLLIDVSLENYNEEEPTYYSIAQFTKQDGTTINGFSDSDVTNSDRKNKTISVDYTNPFKGKQKLELGFRGTLNDVENSFNVAFNEIPYRLGSGLFDFEQNIYAGYATYQNQVTEKVGLKGGLRAEHTDVKSISTGGQQADYQDNYISLFPSASASYKVDDDLQFTTSYSRRVSRPRGRQLNPFANRADPNNLFQGNNELRPQFTDSYELGFNKYLGDVSLDGAVYHRNLKDQIQYVSTYDAVQNINKVTFYNLAQQKSYGIESSLDVRPTKAKWFSLRASGNYNYQKAVKNNSQYNLNQSEFKLFSGNLSSNFNLPKGLRAGMRLNYQSPFESYFGSLKSMWSLNLNASKQVLDRKGSIFLRANDLFNTQGIRGSITDNVRSQSVELDWPSQMAFLGFNYNFGKLKKPARRKMQRREERGNDNQPNVGF